MSNVQTEAVLGIDRNCLEPEFIVVISDQAVLLGWHVVSLQCLDAGSPGLVNDHVQYSQLHVALQHSATHQPQVEVKHVVLTPPNHNRDQAVVSKTITQLSIEADVTLIPGDCFHLGQRVAPRSQIELIGLVGQLRDPFQVERLEPRYLGRHRE